MSEVHFVAVGVDRSALVMVDADDGCSDFERAIKNDSRRRR